MQDAKRKLAAIMFTDLVGYSAISHRNETLALELLEEHRQLLRPFFAQRSGREVKTIGDAFLIEFASALDAVECALEIQEALLARNFGMPRERQFRVRIGIHLGDIVQSENDVFGDGVNIAARLQGRCEVGGVCFSRPVYDQVRNRLKIPIRKLRPRRLKNIPEPVHAYSARPDGPGALIRGDRNDLRLRLKLNSRRSAALGFLAASLIAAALMAHRPEPGRVPPETAADLARLDPSRIAVLPFRSIGLAANEEYLGEGLTEELITRLSGIPTLRVIARTSTERYRGGTKSVTEIGRELGVGSVIEGSLSKAEGQLRVDVKFVDTRTQEAVWAERFMEREGRIFKLQAQVSGAVASRLKQRQPASALPAPGDLEPRAQVDSGPAHEAYLAYLKAKFFLGQRSRESIWKAIELFDSAIKLDPVFVRAYVSMGNAFGLLGYYEFMSPHEALTRGAEFAEKARRLDPNSPEAITSLAAQKVYFDHDWVGAERDFRRALELNPSYASAHEWYGEYLIAMGRDAEARKEISAALELDPLSLIINTVAGHPDFFKGNFGPAIARYRAVLELDQRFEPARVWLARALILNGQAAEAVRVIQGSPTDADPKLKIAAALAYAAQGDASSAHRMLKEAGADGQYISSYELAAIDERLGDHAAAVADLRKAYDERAYLAVYLKTDPMMASLREDPAVRELVARLFP